MLLNPDRDLDDVESLPLGLDEELGLEYPARRRDPVDDAEDLAPSVRLHAGRVRELHAEEPANHAMVGPARDPPRQRPPIKVRRQPLRAYDHVEIVEEPDARRYEVEVDGEVDGVVDDLLGPRRPDPLPESLREVRLRQRQKLDIVELLSQPLSDPGRAVAAPVLTDEDLMAGQLLGEVLPEPLRVPPEDGRLVVHGDDDAGFESHLDFPSSSDKQTVSYTI